jgi:hypothetical protein
MVVSIIAGTGALFWGYSLAGLYVPARWLLAAGAAWLFAEWRRLRWAGSLALFVLVGAAGYGLWIGLPVSLMILAAVAALLGWDSAGLLYRLRFAAPKDDVKSIERLGAARTAVVGALGLIIAGVASAAQVRLSFELAVILVLLAGIGLTQVVSWLQRRGG